MCASSILPALVENVAYGLNTKPQLVWLEVELCDVLRHSSIHLLVVNEIQSTSLNLNPVNPKYRK